MLSGRSPMAELLPDFVGEFNARIKDIESFCSIARASELQREALDSATSLLAEVSQEKKAAVSRGDEDYANLLLGCACVVTVLRAELSMWLLLKEEKPDEAWDELVTCQMAAIDATRAHNGFAHLEHHVRRLEAVEKLLFPPQVFISSGMIVGLQECSICGEDYDECEHLIGNPYMGEFCHIIARDIALDHVAIVDYPADKRCRVRHFSVEGGMRNRMTWRVEAQDPKKGAAVPPDGAEGGLSVIARVEGHN